ncbi:MAG: hypothetical protein CFH08_02222 [Alphaproteobacteria bacterium MarineAlpha3_Bin7]|nr:MAG: hypothetical protein CFH08_02222 [Alphaproteobacteria bacterium MarineAlpha3_Bin7]
MASAPILNKIPSMNDNNLLKLYKNGIRAIEKSPTNSQAREVINAIQAEWAKRLEAAKRGAYKANTPNIGMLKSLGYSVGNEGVKTSIRRTILDDIMTINLPIVGSPAYTLEWGEPNSRQRYNKLVRTIQSLIVGARKDIAIEKAVIEWSEDLDYIKSKFK